MSSPGGGGIRVGPRRARRRAGLGPLLACLAVACGGGEAPRDAAAPSVTAAPTADPPNVGVAIDPPAAPGALAPNLAVVAGRPVLSWLESLPGERHRLLVSSFLDGSWSSPVVVAEGGGFFANWADLPAVAESGDGSLVAHWLAKTAEETYAYSPFLARSLDGGATWSELGRLNDDDTPTEHGFVSWVREGDGLRAFWLDGREMAAGGAMALRSARVGETVGASEVLDERVCECCSTAAAVGGEGALVVYRDRDGAEVRDISRVRGGAGDWLAPRPVASDGWRIHGCPVNGPAVEAAGETAVVAWFTGAGEAWRVQLAFSRDAGGSFGPAVLVDEAAPAGRVDVDLDGVGGAVVSWLATAGEAAVVRLRRVAPDGTMGGPLDVATTGAGRASGFPRLLRIGETLYLAWVDTRPADGQRVRARRIPLALLPPQSGPGSA